VRGGKRREGKEEGAIMPIILRKGEDYVQKVATS